MINLQLVRATVEDAPLIAHMQRQAFLPLLNTYHDQEASPANESLARIVQKLQQPETYFYLVLCNGETVGGIRVVDKGSSAHKRISPLFVLPSYQGKGIAQWTIRQAEKLHGTTGWHLDTILQEKGNCHLYEKMGYHPTGEITRINDRMTLICYEK